MQPAWFPQVPTLRHRLVLDVLKQGKQFLLVAWIQLHCAFAALFEFGKHLLFGQQSRCDGSCYRHCRGIGNGSVWIKTVFDDGRPFVILRREVIDGLLGVVECDSDSAVPIEPIPIRLLQSVRFEQRVMEIIYVFKEIAAKYDAANLIGVSNLQSFPRR